MKGDDPEIQPRQFVSITLRTPPKLVKSVGMEKVSAEPEAATLDLEF